MHTEQVQTVQTLNLNCLVGMTSLPGITGPQAKFSKAGLRNRQQTIHWIHWQANTPGMTTLPYSLSTTTLQYTLPVQKAAWTHAACGCECPAATSPPLASQAVPP